MREGLLSLPLYCANRASGLNRCCFLKLRMRSDLRFYVCASQCFHPLTRKRKRTWEKQNRTVLRQWVRNRYEIKSMRNIENVSVFLPLFLPLTSSTEIEKAKTSLSTSKTNASCKRWKNSKSRAVRRDGAKRGGPFRGESLCDPPTLIESFL